MINNHHKSHDSNIQLQNNKSADIEQVFSSFSRSENPLLGNTTGLASTLINIDLQKTQNKQDAKTQRKIERDYTPQRKLLESKNDSENILIKQTERTIEKYRLQRLAQKHSPDHRICSCMSTVTPSETFVHVHYNKKDNFAHYRNLMRCDNVWMCAVCSTRISTMRAEEIRKGYAYGVDILNFRVVMVTYTMAHNRHDSLNRNIIDLRSARKKMRSGRKWQAFKRNYGYVGAISALEVTYNEDNGWHTHVHELMIFDAQKAEFEVDVKENILDRWLSDELKAWWQESLSKVGRTCSLKHGIDVTSANQYIAEYVSKYGRLPKTEKWDIANEVTKSASKMAKSEGGLHPFGILSNAYNPLVAEKIRNVYLKLWSEYIAEFKGQKQLFWTTGLKELLNVEDIDDDKAEISGKHVFGLSLDAWRAVKVLNRRAEFLNEVIFTKGNMQRIEKYLIDTIRIANAQQKQNDYWKTVELNDLWWVDDD